MRIHGICITDTYMTHMCLCELEITGKELAKKGATALYHAAHTGIAFVKKALIDKCLLLWFLATGIVFLSFRIHIFDSNLHFELIHKDMVSFYSWEWELSVSLSPKKSPEIMESLGFKCWALHVLNMWLLERNKEKTNKMESYLHLIYIILWALVSFLFHSS